MAYQILRLSRSAMQEQINSATAAGFPHYVYGLLRGDTGDLFYVGKGTADRVFDHLPERSHVARDKSHKARVLRKHGLAGFVYLFAAQDDDSAFSTERDVINAIGVENLTNAREGGLGGKVCSEETRSKLSAASRNSAPIRAPKIQATMRGFVANNPDAYERRVKTLAKVDVEKRNISIRQNWDASSAEDKERRLSGFTASRHSEERKAAVRSALQSDEVRAKLSAIHSTPEGRKKMAAKSTRYEVRLNGESMSLTAAAKLVVGDVTYYRRVARYMHQYGISGQEAIDAFVADPRLGTASPREYRGMA